MIDPLTLLLVNLPEPLVIIALKNCKVLLYLISFITMSRRLSTNLLIVPQSHFLFKSNCSESNNFLLYFRVTTDLIL